MIEININSETAKLKKVIVGIADDRGNKVHENNPKISKYLKQGSLPPESILKKQVDNLANVIARYDVEVLRPENIKNQDQIFARDIAFAIADKFVVSNMKKENRKPEQDGIEYIINDIQHDRIVRVPEGATIEGGDVLIHGRKIFVGITERTNYLGYEFIKNTFKDHEVIAFEMMLSSNPATNILHLDCAFQPVGDKYAIVYEGGFVNRPIELYDIFGSNNILKITQFEMYHMFPNIFSISPDKVISDKSFYRMNEVLHSIGIDTIEIDYQEVCKLGGLFRCSTMPLIRD
ncbi:arginine deiminase family protein [Candidatus Kapaibacterium sp.]